MWKQYEPEGLVLLALSDESKNVVEPFLENFDLPFPVGAGSPSGTRYRISGYPSSFLIDHEGVVLWQGHPMEPGWVDLLPDALRRADAAAGRWDPGECDPLLEKAASRARAGDLAGAWKESGRLLEKAAGNQDHEALVRDFRKGFLAEADERLEMARSMAGEGCYWSASEFVARQSRNYAGTPPESGFKAQARAWKTDRALKQPADLDRRRCRALGYARRGDVEKAVKTLRALLKKAAGTAIEAVIRRDIDRIG